MKTFPIILEFCGGRDTDRLHARLSRDNPEHTVFVLDNASPRNRCHCITHQNAVNSGVGGGICDCIAFARRAGAEYLFLSVNDIRIVRDVRITHFERILDEDPDCAMVSVSLTPSSRQAAHFPWMACHGAQDRVVRHTDLLMCLLRLSFLDSFGGPPVTRSGWGYDWELAYQAEQQGRRLIVCEHAVCEHGVETDKWLETKGVLRRWVAPVVPSRMLAELHNWEKRREMRRVYGERYGDYRKIEFRARYWEQFTGEPFLRGRRSWIRRLRRRLAAAWAQKP